MKSKKFVSALLAVAMLVTLLPAAVFAGEATQHVSTYADLVAALNDANCTEIVLDAEIKAEAMISIVRDNVTLDLNGNTITAAEGGFTTTDENQKSLVNVSAKNVVVKNGTIATTSLNKHALNVWKATDCTIENMVLDHTNAIKGAPLVVAASTATITGTFEAITGQNSWYAVNIDSYASSGNADAKLTFGEGAVVAFTDAYAENRTTAFVAIYAQNGDDGNDTGESIEVAFEKNVTLSTDDSFDYVVVKGYNAAEDAITNPENAGLKLDDNGAVIVPSVLTTDIGDKTFEVGQSVEFTFTTTANGDAGKMVVGTSNFSDASAIEKLEYYEVKDGNWYELTGDFGPGTGFPMSDATSRFRVTFAKAGEYTFTASMKEAGTDNVLCSVAVKVSVAADKSELRDALDDFVAENLDPDDYTPESVAKMRAAISHASDVLNDPNATAEEVADAIAQLKAARDGLVKAEDTTTDTDKEDDKVEGPNTGDSSHVGYGLVIAVVSGLVLATAAGYTLYSKKKRAQR